MSKHQATARELRDRPFALENGASVARQMNQPKGFDGLLRWFLTGFREEMPDNIHVSGVWRSRKPSVDAHGRPREVVPGEHMGGSLLGSPQLSGPFRSLIEESPFLTESAEYEGHKSRAGDEHYATPMRAALAGLKGRHTCTTAERRLGSHDCGTAPFMAITLERTAYLDGDWLEAARTLGIHPDTVRTWVHEALIRLWKRYALMPPARLDDKEVAVA